MVKPKDNIFKPSKHFITPRTMCDRCLNIEDESAIGDACFNCIYIICTDCYNDTVDKNRGVYICKKCNFKDVRKELHT